MSKFFSERFSSLTPYTPGEQPQERKYIKLNTNESPFPPAPSVLLAVGEETARLQLYSDPESRLLTAALAEFNSLHPEQILVGNGSDELLYFAFMAFCDNAHPALFPDITYGFYPVYANVNRVPYRELPVREDLSVDLNEYAGLDGTVFLANPNAPTGLLKETQEIEVLLHRNPNRIVVVDEAYIDFGGKSMIPLIDRYENLLVIQTFSKSKSLAGARLGFAAGNPELIRDLNTLKYSTNPYNVNRMSSAAGIAALKEKEYYREKVRIIMENRSWATEQLRTLGFQVADSLANFIFARSERIDGASLYKKLKERGILVRHFEKARISPYVRITIGTKEEMEALIRETKAILKEEEDV